MQVSAFGKQAVGTGTSKKEAAAEAARKLLGILKELPVSMVSAVSNSCNMASPGCLDLPATSSDAGVEESESEQDAVLPSAAPTEKKPEVLMEWFNVRGLDPLRVVLWSEVGKDLWRWIKKCGEHRRWERMLQHGFLPEHRRGPSRLDFVVLLLHLVDLCRASNSTLEMNTCGFKKHSSEKMNSLRRNELIKMWIVLGSFGHLFHSFEAEKFLYQRYKGNLAEGACPASVCGKELIATILSKYGSHWAHWFIALHWLQTMDVPQEYSPLWQEVIVKDFEASEQKM